MKSNCEFCMNYVYDEDYDSYMCLINLDEDEHARFMYGGQRDCPYFRFGDDYTIVKKQN